MAIAIQALYRGHRVRQRVVCAAQRDFEIDLGNLDGTAVRDACTWPHKQTACLPTLGHCHQRAARADFVAGLSNAPQQRQASIYMQATSAGSCSVSADADAGQKVLVSMAATAAVSDDSVSSAEVIEAAEAAGADAFLHMSPEAIRDELVWARAALRSREQYLRLAHTSGPVSTSTSPSVERASKLTYESKSRTENGFSQ